MKTKPVDVKNVVKSLNFLPNPDALKIWWLCDFQTIDCIWDEKTNLHYFEQRNNNRTEPGSVPSSKRGKIIALLEKGIEQ